MRTQLCELLSKKRFILWRNSFAWMSFFHFLVSQSYPSDVSSSVCSCISFSKIAILLFLIERNDFVATDSKHSRWGELSLFSESAMTSPGFLFHYHHRAISSESEKEEMLLPTQIKKILQWIKLVPIIFFFIWVNFKETVVLGELRIHWWGF